MLYRRRLSDTYVTCVCQTAGRSQNNSFMPYPVSVFYYGFLSIIVYFAVIIAAVLGSDTTSYTGTMSFAMLSTEFQQSLGVTLTQYCVFLIGYSLVGCITGCCILLGCVSLGQLYTKHRILGAILAYFIVTMIMQVITYLAMLPAYGKLFAASAAGDTLPLMSFMMPAFIAI